MLNWWQCDKTVTHEDEAPPQKNGLVVTNLEPRYEMYRHDELIGTFQKNPYGKWLYRPSVFSYSPALMNPIPSYTFDLTLEEITAIQDQLTILNGK